MKLTLLTAHQRITLYPRPGQTILEAIREGAARQSGDAAAVLAGVSAPCGGRGTCGKCMVSLPAASDARQVLACRTTVQDGMLVQLPEPEAPEVLKTGPEQAAHCSDPGRSGYGIACDLGTTTVVLCLVSLADGRTIGTIGAGNAQRGWGSDVISRIRASMDGERDAMTAAIRRQLAGMLLRLCSDAGIAAAELKHMTVAGNTTMCHLLAGLAPDGMGAAPFVPLSLFGNRMPAAVLELPFTGDVYLLPAVSGYVGGDITADLLAAGMDRMQTPVFLIDVGTNGEMALGCGERFLCCATAAGPAFEGAGITCGMTAGPGAISEVRWSENGPVCTVIGGGSAKGICGSGLIDAAAMLLDLGAVDETGRMPDPVEETDEIPPEILPYLFLTGEEMPAFRLTEQICVTQADIRMLQLGKGAIAAGAAVLRERFAAEKPGVEPGALLLAGGFGSFIRPESAARIGLIPGELLPVTRAVGNSALAGAQQALCSAEAEARLQALQHNMEYLELSGMAAFTAHYMDEMLFPERPEPEEN